MDLETLNPDAVEEIFARHGASSITLSDASDRPVLEPAPGETPLWRDTRITGLFSPDADLGAWRTDLLQSLSIDDLPENEVSVLADRAWEHEWRRDFGPMQFGSRLWICRGDSSVDEQLTVVGCADEIDGTFDVVVANILVNPLIELAEPIAGRVNGGCVLALSGILSEQVDQVLEAYRPWIEFDEPVSRQQDAQTWARLTGRRIEG